MRLLRAFSTASAAVEVAPTDPALLRRIVAVLFSYRRSPLQHLHRRLSLIPLPPRPLLPELFLQLSSLYPSAPSITRFLSYLTTSCSFSHTPPTAARYISLLAAAQDLSLLHSTLVSLPPSLLSPPAIRFAARGFAEVRDVTECARIVELTPGNEVRTLAIVARAVCCDSRLPDVALEVVRKVRANYAVFPSAETWDDIIVGFCRAGEMAMACQVWNEVQKEGIEVGMRVYLAIAVTFVKSKRVEDGLIMFGSMRRVWFQEMDVECYRVVVEKLCTVGSMGCAFMVFAEMVKRGMEENFATVGHLISGLVQLDRMDEAYKLFYTMQEADINVYHGLMKGLIKFRRMKEATQLFRNMIENGCEPNMHTYIMLLKGHMGDYGRKGADPLVNFDNIFVGGLVKAGKSLEANKFAERTIWKGVNMPKFDYNKFLHCFSNEEGVVMFEEVSRKLQGVGLVDLGYIFSMYGKRMATRDRRRSAMNESKEIRSCKVAERTLTPFRGNKLGHSFAK